MLCHLSLFLKDDFRSAISSYSLLILIINICIRAEHCFEKAWGDFFYYFFYQVINYQNWHVVYKSYKAARVNEIVFTNECEDIMLYNSSGNLIIWRPVKWKFNSKIGYLSFKSCQINRKSAMLDQTWLHLSPVTSIAKFRDYGLTRLIWPYFPSNHQGGETRW